MSSCNIGTRTITKRKLNAPPRVYENLVGEVFSGPGVGTTWRMPIRFLEKSGTPIFVSLTGEGGRKAVFQRSNRAEWIKRLLATLAWKEVRIGLGYKDAVVWIGSKRFQPTSEDLKGFISDDEACTAGNGVRAIGSRNGKARMGKGDDEMAKKQKVVKKSKKSKKSKASSDGRSGSVSDRVRFIVEKVNRGVRVTIDGRPKTARVISKAALRESVVAEAYGYTDKFIGPREKIGNKGGGLYNRIRKAMGWISSGASKDKKSKSGKKAKKSSSKETIRKGVVKKVGKRPITKKSSRKVIHKVKRH